MCSTICVLAIQLSVQYAALKGGYYAISRILSGLRYYKLDSYVCARALSNPSESKSGSAIFVNGSEVNGSAAVLTAL